MMKFLKKFYLGIMMVFLYIPIVVLIVQSFNAGESRAKWEGFSFRWYAELFQDDRIVQRGLACFAPGERSVSGHQHHLHFGRIQFPSGESIDDLIAGFDLVIAFDPFVFHEIGAGDRHAHGIGMGGAPQRHIVRRLRPGGREGAVGMDHAPDVRKRAVEHQMRRRVAGRPRRAFDRPSVFQ